MVLSGLPDEFEQQKYAFQKVDASAAKLIRYWLKEPHVEDWWTPSEEAMQIMEQATDNPDSKVVRYIASHNGRDFAYIQCYDLAEKPDIWENNPQPEGTFGIDQFIGDPQMIGFGHGTNFIKSFIEELKKQPEVKKIIVDPAPDNSPAIKCFGQVGFRTGKEIETPNGPALLMSIINE